jgi:hypothetical protein
VQQNMLRRINEACVIAPHAKKHLIFSSPLNCATHNILSGLHRSPSLVLIEREALDVGIPPSGGMSTLQRSIHYRIGSGGIQHVADHLFEFGGVRR